MFWRSEEDLIGRSTAVGIQNGLREKVELKMGTARIQLHQADTGSVDKCTSRALAKKQKNGGV